MRLIHIGLTLAMAMAAFGDTVTLKSGRVINGTYLGGSPRTVKVEVGDRIETLDVSDVVRIEFGGPAAPASVPDSDRRPVMRRGDNGDNAGDRPVLRRGDDADSANDRPVLRRADDSGGGGTILRPDADAQAAPPPPQANSVQLPAGTNVVVRMIDGVDSETNSVGQTFAASLDAPVTMPNGDVIIRRGAEAVVKLVDSKESGKFTGRSELTVSLVSVKMDDGRSVNINTQSVSRESSSRGERTAKVAGGTAAVGAIIGAIAGGGKGAAVGAAAGGAAGAGAEAVTKGQRVKIPSETRLTFVLDSPVSL
jgi:hypothetical protein